jgi:hypothetical protein
MKYLMCLAIWLALVLSTVRAQETHFAGDPLALGAGARALGMGGAFVAISDDATAFYWNPAGFATHTKRELHAQHTEQFGGSVDHDIIAISLPVRKGGFGLGLVRLGVDNISLTQLEDPDRPLGPDNRPIVSQTIGTADNAIYLAYAHPIRPFFTTGVTVKFIHRDLTLGTGTGFGIDVGILYRPWAAISFGLVIRDLTETRIHFHGGNVDPIPPSSLMGLSYLHAFSETSRVLSSLSVHLADDNSGIGRNQTLSMGLEYQFKQRLMLRLGRQGGRLTAGAGIKVVRATIDLALLESKQLNNTYRVSTSIFF